MKNLLSISLAVLLGASVALAADDKGHNSLVKEVRHELVMLPYYGVFDNLAYKVDGYTVTLLAK